MELSSFTCHNRTRRPEELIYRTPTSQHEARFARVASRRQTSSIYYTLWTLDFVVHPCGWCQCPFRCSHPLGRWSRLQAKAIDICFDLFVGRGSQVLVALATYPILRRSILRSMEVREFSLALLLPFFMERLSVYSLWAMFANMRSRRAKPKSNDQTEQIEFRKARVRIDWRVILVFLVGCYVLALPTFTSVMTSYQSRSGPYLPSTGSEGYFAANDFDDRIPDFVLPYGHLIGLSMDAPLYNDTDSDIISACSECKCSLSYLKHR